MKLKDPLAFPERMTVELPEALRKGLEAVADRERHTDDHELVQIVISRGLVALLAEDGEEGVSSGEVAENLAKMTEQRAELASSAKRIYPVPSVMFKKRREQAEGRARDLAFAKTPQDAGELSPEPVEGYVAFPLTPEMQDDLETFLEGHPDASIETACMTVFQLGMKMIELDLQEIRAARGEKEATHVGPLTRRADERLRMAEALYRRARARCSG